MGAENFKDFLLQKLEYERHATQLYVAAIEATGVPQTRDEWERHLEHSWTRSAFLSELCTRLGFDPNEETPGRIVVRKMVLSLMAVIRGAQASRPSHEAEQIANECICLAQARDVILWELVRTHAEKLNGSTREALIHAVAEIELITGEPVALF